MKKFLLIILSLMMSLTLTSCNNEVKENVYENELFVPSEFVIEDNIFTDEVYGIKFEMQMPSEWNNDEYRIEKTVMENQTVYSAYDKINEESDGGYMFSLYVTNDYPMVNGKENIEDYEAMYTAVGESKILYSNLEKGIMCSINTASDVQYDFTSEEKTAHYTNMIQLIKDYSETFIVNE